MPALRRPEVEWRLRRGGRASAGAWAGFLLSIAASAVLLQAKSRLDERAWTAEQDLERVMTSAMAMPMRRVQPESIRSPAELRQLRSQIALLNRDWAALFGDLLPGKQPIKLLGLEVNAETAVLRLTAHAASAAAANDYAEALQARERQLQDVKLLLLERKPDGIHFEVSARWAE